MKIDRGLYSKLFIIIISILSVINSSCTALQHRYSDKKIKSKFERLDPPISISYFKFDSLTTKIRVQSMISDHSKVNLVFLHGSPRSLSDWDGYLGNPSLAKIASMYAIDRPGYGYSDFGKSEPSIDAQSKIISAFIHIKKLDNVIIVGASYGGTIAARVGVINPKVIGVVMISPALDPIKEKDIWASRFTQWKLTRWFVPRGYRAAGDEKTFHAKELTLIEKDWGQLKVPVLHIHGDDDNLVPYENTEYSKMHFPDVKIITIPEKGHEITWKTIDLQIPRLLEFISQLEEGE